MKTVTSTENSTALYFLTEQACCLAQVSGRETDDFRVCREAVEYLSDGCADALGDFLARTDAVKLDPTGLEDYDIEEYPGKDHDVHAAVSLLESLGHNTDTPADKQALLIKAANLIADFYGIDDTPEATPT